MSNKGIIWNNSVRKKEQRQNWEDFIEKFIRNQVSHETQKAYLIDLKQFFKWVMSKKNINFPQITFKDAIEYRDYLKSFGGRIVNGNPQEASNITVHRKICTLSSFYQFLEKEVLLKENKAVFNPFKKIERYKIDNSITVTEALTKSEMTTLMNYLNSLPKTLINLRDQAIIETLFSVVIRNKALINIKRKNLYKVGERYKIKYMDKGSRIFDETLHPQTTRSIFVYLDAMKISGREVLAEDALFQPMFNRSDGLASLEDKREAKNANKHLSVNQITNILRRHCVRAGIGNWVTSHSAKATVTSELVEKHGVHLAQRKTKHKKTDQVIAYYGKRREREISVFDDLDYMNI